MKLLGLLVCGSQLYGAATMNNTLCLAVFMALVYVRGLEWVYSAGEFTDHSCAVELVDLLLLLSLRLHPALGISFGV